MAPLAARLPPQSKVLKIGPAADACCQAIKAFDKALETALVFIFFKSGCAFACLS